MCVCVHFGCRCGACGVLVYFGGSGCMRSVGLCVRQYLMLLYEDMLNFKVSVSMSSCWSI